MIVIDDRQGAKELVRYFSPYDVHVEVTRLEFADICWDGNGPDGPCMIGMERKTITDLLHSMRENRLSGHQLPGLHRDYAFVYLIVEGIYRPGEHGELEHNLNGKWLPVGGTRPVMYREIDSYLSTLETRGGIIVRRSSSRQETVAQIVNLSKWWEKDWEAHHAHQVIYCPTPDQLISSRKVSFISAEETIRRKYGEEAVLCWKWAAQLPGIDRKAELVARYFGSGRRMAMAGPKAWQKIEGIGKVTAEVAVRLIGRLASEG